MNRRDVIALIKAAASAWPLGAWAQQPTPPVVGLIGTDPPETSTGRLLVFREALAEAGYVDGRDVTVEYHWPRGNAGQLPALAADLARRPVAIIVATDTQAALAAKTATGTVPG
jgi:putative ABC transport system substrate-binding protein